MPTGVSIAPYDAPGVITNDLAAPKSKLKVLPLASLNGNLLASIVQSSDSLLLL
jgi:hypothetical protein